jgi:hypothetical protein
LTSQKSVVDYLNSYSQLVLAADLMYSSIWIAGVPADEE